MAKAELDLTAEERANQRYLTDNRAELFKQYPDEYVAIIGGVLVGHGVDSQVLSQDVRKSHPGQNILLHQLTSEPVQPLKVPIRSTQRQSFFRFPFRKN